ncbi:MAG: hypothetical protein HZA49_11040 [Planctomycetes bacterium]|nr:hypothetical protein [Planctomycetota bacterium]
MGNWKMLTGGLVVFAVLAAGIYIYAESCGSHDKASGSGKSCGSGDKCDHGAGKGKAAKTPENLIKEADKLLKEVDKTKDVKPLMTHCQEMMSKSLTMMAECNRALKGEKPDMAKLAGMVETSNNLMKKSTELSDKCLSLMPKPEKVEEKGETQTLYVCPMGCIEPQAEPGRCPKCGMNLEKKK